MTTPLSPLGSRVEERLARAAARADEHQQPSPEAAAEMSPGEWVSKHAEELALQDKLAQQLGLAIQKALSRMSWKDSQHFVVEVTPDFAALWYVIRITRENIWRTTPPQTYVVEDETLAKHTASVPMFHTWIRAVANGLLVMFTPAPSKLWRDPKQVELEHHEKLVEHHEKLEKATQELLSLGFRRHDRPEDQMPSEAEIQAAIASIRKALDARLDR